MLQRGTPKEISEIGSRAAAQVLKSGYSCGLQRLVRLVDRPFGKCPGEIDRQVAYPIDSNGMV